MVKVSDYLTLILFDFDGCGRDGIGELDVEGKASRLM